MQYSKKLRTATQEIGVLQQQIDVINDELNRQTQFRGYYLLNTDIQQLENSANGDFAFSAESGTVCMYDQNLYDSGDIVPNQVTPASEATPLVDSGTGDAGNSNEYSRGDNKHPLQVSDVLPAKDTATCEEGTANTCARIDHTHHVNLSNGVPKKDSGTGTAGTANIYSSATNQHPLNVDPTTANVPLVNATAAANGTSDYYCRNDHLHPQQLTYDGNLTAIKFIKSGGLATEVLCTNGDTTTLDNKLSTTYSSGAGGYIRLYVFPAGNSTGNLFIEFKIYLFHNVVQIIKLQPNYTVNDVTTVYGIFTAPTKVSISYLIENGANQLFHTHTCTGITAIYLAYIRLESVGSIRIVVTDQSTFSPTRITEILSQDVVTTVSSGIQVRINYNYRYGGIMQNTLQVNPTVQIKGTYNNGIRISIYLNESSLNLACSNTAISGTVADQWEISKNNDDALTIVSSSLRQTDHSVSLSINSESSLITFNNNALVDVGTDYTITSRKSFKNDQFQIQPAGITNPLILFISNSNYNCCKQILNQDELILSFSSTQTDKYLYINLCNTVLSNTYANVKISQRFILNAGTTASFAGFISGNIQINPKATSYDDGLRIAGSDSNTGNATIQLGYSRISNTGGIEGQWVIFTSPNNSINNPQGFAIAVASQAGDNTRGLKINADGNTLTFNGKVLRNSQSYPKSSIF